MYEIPQSGLLANQLLTKFLAQYVFHPTKFTTGIWTHGKKSTQFTLVVEKFSIQYNKKDSAEYLIKTL